jgi:hypothetical protein
LKTDTKKWIELLAVAVTGLLKFIIMDWLQMRAFYICGACLFWLIYVLIKYKSDKNILKNWGFKPDGFRQSFLFLIPFTIASIITFSFFAYYNNTINLNWHILPVFLFYPAWGLIQQFMMLGLITANLKSIKRVKFNNLQIALITACIFSMVHYPYVSLMIYTFIMQIIFTIVYLKWGNLWSLGIHHGWIATFLLYFMLKRDLWTEFFAWF